MPNVLATVFQKLEQTFGSDNIRPKSVVNSYQIQNNHILDTATSQEEYQMKVAQARQQALLAKQWVKANQDLTVHNMSRLNDVKLMYRDADLMDCFPEIGTALDIQAEEATYVGSTGFMINVTSKSERIKSILNDLFVNRLMVNVTLPMIARSLCKYGNNYMLYNISKDNGLLGWKQLPVYEMERYENGMEYPYAASSTSSLSAVDETKLGDTKFVWVGQNEYIPYRSWQIAHFRMLYDSQFLPYGVSTLHKARRHFRMLSIMEDMMLMYRLDRSVERRIFKIDVGAIDVDDVPAYVQQIADNFKRTPIIDPMTGQVDLRKGIMSQTEDFFIPVRDPSTPSPIETLAAGQNLTAMDDINFVQNKVFTALRVPKAFLNFEEDKGDGKNLSLLDVRFMRTVNRIQQSLLMELNKAAMIHLYLLGFTDELTNFSLTMNNPSSQAEMLEIENIAKKITTAKDAVSDPGGGIPLTSLTWAWKNIMKWSDKEIQKNLEDIRLEFALAAELQKTQQIIKRTRLFDPVDNLYGEPNAQYVEGQEGGGEGGPDGGMGGGGFGGGGFGGDMDFGGDDGMEMGAEGDMAMDDAAMENGIDMGGAPEPMGDDGMGGGAPEPMGDSIVRKLNIIKENKQKQLAEEFKNKRQHYLDLLCKRLTQKTIDESEEKINQTPEMFNDKILFINEGMTNMIKQLGEYQNDNIQD